MTCFELVIVVMDSYGGSRGWSFSWAIAGFFVWVTDQLKSDSLSFAPQETIRCLLSN